MASWTPYAVVTFIGQFGPDNTHIEPWISALPALCAKVVFFIRYLHFFCLFRLLFVTN